MLSGKHAAQLDEHHHSSKGHGAALPRRAPRDAHHLDEASDKGYVAAKTLGQLQDDLHKFRQRCETNKTLPIAIADDDRPLVGRRATRLLNASRRAVKVLGDLCDAWSVQSWDAQDRDAAALAPLGVGGPKLLQALNSAGYLPGYDTGRRHFEVAPRVRPTGPWLLEAPRQVAAFHVWHLCIDEINFEDLVTISREALALRLCATCCRHPLPLVSGDDVEAPT